MTRILYSGTRNVSSWAFRAWLALKELNIDFEEKVVDIRRPQRWQALASVGEFSPPAAVPVLVENDVVIYDSLAIMEYANDIGGGGLLPKDLILRAKARSLAAWQHSTMGKTICPKLSFESAFYPNKRVLSADEVTGAHKLYALWQQELQDHQGLYLFGELSLADLALVPTVLRLTSHLPIDERWPLANAWAERLLCRTFVKQWLLQAQALEPIYLECYLS